ncbi:MAG: NAD(P)H:quinone oxidoreductase [Armatimonadetes bacterium]|nr:NAD(P)H:quinone oxidoreductase [Candidatus Hippobium faecium]
MNIFIAFHTIYGHTCTLAENIAKGAESVRGSQIKIAKIKETLPNEILKEMGADHFMDKYISYPTATVDDMVWADCIILGSPTYFGKISSQMGAFMDSTGILYPPHALKNKIGGAFVSSGCQNGGAEEAIRTIHNYFLHHSMIIAGTDTSDTDLERNDTVFGTSPYGVSCVAGEKYNYREVSETEKKFAFGFGKRLAEITEKLKI